MPLCLTILPPLSFILSPLLNLLPPELIRASSRATTTPPYVSPIKPPFIDASLHILHEYVKNLGSVGCIVLLDDRVDDEGIASAFANDAVIARSCFRFVL